MEYLATCSKIMYDKDILDKNKDIIQLKKQLSELNTPKIIYHSMDDWNISLNKAYINIKQCIYAWIIENTVEYENMFGWGNFENGLTSNQRCAILEHIKSSLIILTKNEKWSTVKANEIIYSVESFFYAMDISNTWVTIYHSLTAEQISNIVLNIIIFHIDNLLLDTPIIQCTICKKTFKATNCDTCKYN